MKPFDTSPASCPKLHPARCCDFRLARRAVAWTTRLASRPSAAAALLAIVLLPSGCAAPGKAPPTAIAAPSARTPIDELNLLAVPVALNLDHLPGLDGFMIKVYPGSQKRPNSVPIDGGTLDVFMFDGVIAGDTIHVPEPLRVWTYTAADLKQFEIRTSIGAGYQLAPLWGEARPTKDKITVFVRYTAPNGGMIASSPSVISVALK
jgi:hypothetical protein